MTRYWRKWFADVILYSPWSAGSFENPDLVITNLFNHVPTNGKNSILKFNWNMNLLIVQTKGTFVERMWEKMIEQIFTVSKCFSNKRSEIISTYFILIWSILMRHWYRQNMLDFLMVAEENIIVKKKINNSVSKRSRKYAIIVT